MSRQAQAPSPSPVKTPQTHETPFPPHAGQGSPFYHYVVVRADLPPGYQAAQIVHAAGESAANRPVPPGTHAVVLVVPDEDALWDVHSDLVHYCPSYALPEGYHASTFNGIHVVIHDPDAPKGWPGVWGEDHPGLKRGGEGEATAIGVPPTQDRKWILKALGRLPLLR